MKQYVRPALWLLAISLLMVPLVAMQFSDEVNWAISDFVFAAVLLIGTGLAFEGVLRLTQDRKKRLAAAAGLTLVFLLIWAEGAVGVFGPGLKP